jgi:hypothetical protein
MLATRSNSWILNKRLTASEDGCYKNGQGALQSTPGRRGDPWLVEAT